MSIFFLFHWIVLLLSLNSISCVFFSKTLEQYWSNHGLRLLLESLSFGDDVIKLFVRYVIYNYPFVTPLGFRVIVYPFDFGLGMCWGCIGWNWEAFKIFLEVGNRSQFEAIMGFFGSKIGVDMGEILTWDIIEAHLGRFWWILGEGSIIINLEGKKAIFQGGVPIGWNPKHETKWPKRMVLIF